MAAKGVAEGLVQQCLQPGGWPLGGQSGCTGGCSC